MKKQNKALYESLVNGIAKALKKSLNEDIITTSNIDPKYYDENGDIDLSDMESLPQEIINSLIMDLLEKNGYIQEDDQDDDCLMCSIMPDVDPKNDTATVLTRSMEDYGVCLSFNANIDYDVSFHAGMKSHDYDVPDDPDETECNINNIEITGLMLTDGDQELMIDDADIIEKVKEFTEYSEVIDNFRISKEENYDPDDYDDDWDYDDDRDWNF